MATVLGNINYAKNRGQVAGGKGLPQGGEFMKNKVKGNKKQLASLDTHEMEICNARPFLNDLSIDTNGFVRLTIQTKLTETLDVLFEEKEQQIRSIYWPEIIELARENIQTSDGRKPKYVFALGTQKFTEDKSRGLLGSYSRSAHADFSDVVFDGAYKMLTKRGVGQMEAQSLDLMFVNAWRPFGRVVSDNPLCILDWRTVDPNADVHGLKRGQKVVKGNIYGSTVTYNANHRWMYLPNMTPNEVWFFKQADSRENIPGLCKHAFHTSFRQPGQGSDVRGRRSIAVRLICGFEKANEGNSKL